MQSRGKFIVLHDMNGWIGGRESVEKVIGSFEDHRVNKNSDSLMSI